MVLVQLLLFLIVVILVAVERVRRKTEVKKYPPGPFSWPFVGNVKEVRRLAQKLGGQHEAFIELSKRYNSPVIKLKIGSDDTYVVSGVPCIHAVFNGEEYDGRPWNFFIELRNMGARKGITMNDGEDWRKIRNWFLKSMKSVGFARREMSDSIKKELDLVLQNFESGSVHTIKPLIIPAIINVLWTFAAGKGFDKNRLQTLIKLMERRAQVFDMTGGILSAYPWIRFIAPNYSGYNLLITLNNEFKSILMETIEEHKKNYVPGSKADLIDMFLNEMYAGKGPQAGFDEDQLIMILVDILLAGLNITATTLDFLFLNMLINQNSQRLVHEEIDRVIGHEKLPDMSDKPKMPYVDAVMIESQRLVPVVPIIGPRRVLEDTKLFDYDIPRNSAIILNLYSIHFDSNLYPEPRSFKPERFLKNGTLIEDNNLTFFGKGKRMCPGVPLARSALFILFTGIMQRFELLPLPGQKPPTLEVNTGLTISPKPYEVLLLRRVTSNRS